MRKIFLMIAALTAALATAPRAMAEGFALYEWGARGSGMANAVVAQGVDASAVAYNPAAITRLEGTQIMVGGAIITPKMTIDAKNPWTGEASHNRVMRHYYFVPHGYFTTHINDTVSFGFGAFTRYGLGNDYPGGWDGQYNLQNVKLMTVSLNPNFAFRLTDKLSLAIGIEGQVVRMKMHKETGSLSLYDPNPYDCGGQTIKGSNNLGVGFNAALHYQFNDQWSAGFSYRSAVTHDIKGKTRFNDQAAVQALLGTQLGLGGQYPISSLSLSGKFRMPDHFSLGVAYKPVDSVTIEVGGQYTVWSKFRNFNIEFDDPVLAQLGRTDKMWKDTWLFNIGAEWWVTDWWAVRAGFSYETSPINKGYADYMVETDGRSRYSLGTGFRFGAWTIDMAWTMFRSCRGEYGDAAGPTGINSKGVLDGHSHHGITHAGTLSIGYKF